LDVLALTFSLTWRVCSHPCGKKKGLYPVVECGFAR